MSLLAACGGDSVDPTATSVPTQPAAAEPTSEPTTPPTVEPTATAEPTVTTAPPSPTATAAPSATPTTAPATTLDGGDPMMGKEMDAPDGPGGTLIEAAILDVRSLHPALFGDQPSYSIGGMIYQNLTQPHIETLEPVGKLANGWETNDDATVWTLSLQDGVTWHDGKPFTAEDVQFTYETLLNPEVGSSHTATLASKIESVKAENDLSVVFTLKHPVVDFLVDIAGMYYMILPKHIWENVPPAEIASSDGATGQDAAMVVGTGPFKFKEWIPADHVTLLPNDDYWGGDVYLEQYIYKVVPDTSAAVTLLTTGEVDVIMSIPGSELRNLVGAPVDIVGFDTLTFNFYGTQLDETKSTKFVDARVRKALFYALDRQAIIDTIYFGAASLAVGTMPKLSWAYNPDGIDKALHYEFDPELARQLLDEAGWVVGDDGIRAKDGEKLAFTMYCLSSNPAAVLVAQAYQGYWREVGIDMTPSPEPFPALFARLTQTLDFEAFMSTFGWNPTPDQSTMWKCSSFGRGFNFVKYCNPVVDELLDAAMAELDREKRIEIYTEFQNTLLEDLPMAVTDFPKQHSGISKKVHNLFANAQNARFNCEKWWVEA